MSQTSRNLGVERVFNLGDYKSLRVIDTIENLPVEWVLNNEILDKLRYLQLVGTDLTYERYVAMTKKLPVSNEDRLIFLEEERINTMDELKSIVQKQEIDEYFNTYLDDDKENK